MIRVFLDIQSEKYSPNEISELIGCSPDDFHCIGDITKSSLLNNQSDKDRPVNRYKFHSWKIKPASDIDSYFIEDFIESILCKIRPYKKEIMNLDLELNKKIFVWLTIDINDSTPGCLLSPEIMNELSSLGISIEIDISV